MKNLILILTLLFTFSGYAQVDVSTTTPDKHEIKGNVFNLLIFKSPEFSYEYLINEDSSVGVSLMINLENLDEVGYGGGPYYNEQFALTPYYRRYFSGKYAERFFLETFTMLNRQKDILYSYDYGYDANGNYYENNSNSTESSTNLAFGIALGSKFTSPGGFMFEFYGGVGRNIYQSNKIEFLEFVPRLGVSLGYRF